MASPTKSRTQIWAGQTLTAGSAPTSGGWQDLRTVFESTFNMKLTNGGTGPTVPAQFQIQVANDWNSGSPTLVTNFGGALVGSTVNNDVNYFSVDIPIPYQAARVVAGSNTGQNVTADADISTVTVIA